MNNCQILFFLPFIHLDLIEKPGKAMVEERKSRFHHEIRVLSKNSNVRRESK